VRQRRLAQIAQFDTTHLRSTGSGMAAYDLSLCCFRRGGAIGKRSGLNVAHGGFEADPVATPVLRQVLRFAQCDSVNRRRAAVGGRRKGYIAFTATMLAPPARCSAGARHRSRSPLLWMAAAAHPVAVPSLRGKRRAKARVQAGISGLSGQRYGRLGWATGAFAATHPERSVGRTGGRHCETGWCVLAGTVTFDVRGTAQFPHRAARL
jgi:hypothetical protein